MNKISKIWLMAVLLISLMGGDSLCYAEWTWVHSTDRYSEYIDVGSMSNEYIHDGRQSTFDDYINNKHKRYIAWTKTVDSWTGTAHKVLYSFDFAQNCMYIRHEVYIDKNGMSSGEKNYLHRFYGDLLANEYLVCDDTASDFFWYVRDAVNHKNEFEKWRNTKNRLVYFGTATDKQGSNYEIYVDAATMKIDEYTVTYTEYEYHLDKDLIKAYRKIASPYDEKMSFSLFQYTRTYNGRYNIKRYDYVESHRAYPGSVDEMELAIMKNFKKFLNEYSVKDIESRKAALKWSWLKFLRDNGQQIPDNVMSDAENEAKKINYSNLEQALCNDYKKRIEKLNLPLDKMPEVTNFMANLSPDSVTDLFKTVIYNDDDKEYKAFFHAVPIINLSIEYIAAYDEKYKNLFTDGERKICRDRLAEKYGYKHVYKQKTEPAGNGAKSSK